MHCQAEIPLPGSTTRTTSCSRRARRGFRTCKQHNDHEAGIPRRQAARCESAAADAERRGDRERALRLKDRAQAWLAELG